ncbi:hypothetical protein ACJH6J_22060 [Mycobacterium sp. SMC-18]|uniref:hypothetical protein n=1 Tax=Mycobacterium sp. SMC-18 TaxID=3381629 RepID=UPI003876F4AE
MTDEVPDEFGDVTSYIGSAKHWAWPAEGSVMNYRNLPPDQPSNGRLVTGHRADAATASTARRSRHVGGCTLAITGSVDWTDA